ncbi:Uncharacterised protein [Salmonella enterica subsp. arizonae]|nr:Uncharacterised protein [Salmonella enterica subsp. arizonae]
MNGIAVSFQDKIIFPLRVIFHHCRTVGASKHALIFMNGMRIFPTALKRVLADAAEQPRRHFLNRVAMAAIR